jgi:hypothetical protein
VQRTRRKGSHPHPDLRRCTRGHLAADLSRSRASQAQVTPDRSQSRSDRRTAGARQTRDLAASSRARRATPRGTRRNHAREERRDTPERVGTRTPADLRRCTNLAGSLAHRADFWQSPRCRHNGTNARHEHRTTCTSVGTRVERFHTTTAQTDRDPYRHSGGETGRYAYLPNGLPSVWGDRVTSTC